VGHGTKFKFGKSCLGANVLRKPGVIKAFIGQIQGYVDVTNISVSTAEIIYRLLRRENVYAW
jgi:hypothetical protein